MSNLVCPECRGELAVREGGVVQCTVHGGNYRVLFHRAAAAVAGDVPAGAKCAGHPGVDASELCMSCGAPMCATCACAMPDGSRICPACVGKPRAVVRPMAAATPRALGECALHPGQEAFVRCDACGALMCNTCNFSLPGNQHACPKCVGSASSRGLSPKRKKMMIGAYALAVWSTVAFVFIIVAAREVHGEAEQQVLGLVMMFAILVPSIAGAGLGFGALDKRRGNTVALWIAAVWNLLLVAGFILMSLVGTFS